MRDVVSHVIGLDCEMLGDPRPIHTLPRDLYHVTNEHQRYMEMQVDVRRHHTAPEMTSELEYTIIRRNRQLRNESRDPGRRSAARSAPEQTLEQAMRTRAFDVWVHEQDLRAALGRPGNLRLAGRARRPGRAAGRAAEGRRQGRGGAAQFGGRLRRARPGGVHAHRPRRQQGRGTLETAPALGPAATLTLDWETYVRLACGRVTADARRRPHQGRGRPAHLIGGDPARDFAARTVA